MRGTLTSRAERQREIRGRQSGRVSCRSDLSHISMRQRTVLPEAAVTSRPVFRAGKCQGRCSSAFLCAVSACACFFYRHLPSSFSVRTRGNRKRVRLSTRHGTCTRTGTCRRSRRICDPPKPSLHPPRCYYSLRRDLKTTPR